MVTGQRRRRTHAAIRLRVLVPYNPQRDCTTAQWAEKLLQYCYLFGCSSVVVVGGDGAHWLLCFPLLCPQKWQSVKESLMLKIASSHTMHECVCVCSSEEHQCHWRHRFSFLWQLVSFLTLALPVEHVRRHFLSILRVCPTQSVSSLSFPLSDRLNILYWPTSVVNTSLLVYLLHIFAYLLPSSHSALSPVKLWSYRCRGGGSNFKSILILPLKKLHIHPLLSPQLTINHGIFALFLCFASHK